MVIYFKVCWNKSENRLVSKHWHRFKCAYTPVFTTHSMLDYEVLIKCLHDLVNIYRTAPNSSRSFLSRRPQKVVTDKVLIISLEHLLWGLPGIYPSIQCVYEATWQDYAEISAELSSLCWWHPALFPLIWSGYVSVFSQFLTAVGNWMWVNHFKLNPDKTDIMVIGRPLDLWGIGTPIIDRVQHSLLPQVHNLVMFLNPLLHPDLQVTAAAMSVFQ